MSESEQVIWFAIAAGAGIVLGVAGSLWIDSLVRRSRVMVFGWLEREYVSEGRLSVYVKNDGSRRTVITDAGAVMKNGSRVSAVGGAPVYEMFSGDMPATLEPHDVAVVCVFGIRSTDVLDDLGACYVVMAGGRVLKGPIYEHGIRAV